MQDTALWNVLISIHADSWLCECPILRTISRKLFQTLCSHSALGEELFGRAKFKKPNKVMSFDFWKLIPWEVLLAPKVLLDSSFVLLQQINVAAHLKLFNRTNSSSPKFTARFQKDYSRNIDTI